MKIGKYDITRHDDRNLVLTKTITRIAISDTTNHKKGDEYKTDAFVGYYPSLDLACKGVLKDQCLDAADKTGLEDVLEFIAKGRRHVTVVLEKTGLTL